MLRQNGLEIRRIQCSGLDKLKEPGLVPGAPRLERDGCQVFEKNLFL